MKSISKDIAILLLVFSTHLNLMAQQEVEFRTMQKINLKALELVESYSSNLGFSNPQDKDEFKDLFEKDVLVFNDIMPSNSLNELISIDKYIGLTKMYYKGSSPDKIYLKPNNISLIKNLSDSTGIVTITAVKGIEEECRSNIKYNDEFTINIEIFFNSNSNTYLIKKISPAYDYGKYCILELYKKVLFKDTLVKILKPKNLNFSDLILLKNNRNYDTISPFDDQGRFFIKRIGEDTAIKVVLTNDDYSLLNQNISIQDLISSDTYRLAQSEDDNIRMLPVKQTIFLGLANFGFNKFQTNVLYSKENEINISNNNLSTWQAGIEFGVQLFYKKNWVKNKFYLMFGFEFNRLEFYQYLDVFSYSYYTIDPDNSDYYRTNTINDINENDKISFISYEIKTKYQFKFNKKLSLDLELGLSTNIILNAIYSTHANGQYSGRYKQFYNIDIAENNVYDFGTFDISNNDHLNILNRNYGIVGAFGFDYYLTNNIALNFGINIQQGLLPIYESDKIDFSNNYLEINSLNNISNEYFMRLLSSNIKLMFKF